jgi:hypothetical protein
MLNLGLGGLGLLLAFVAVKGAITRSEHYHRVDGKGNSYVGFPIRVRCAVPHHIRGAMNIMGLAIGQ